MRYNQNGCCPAVHEGGTTIVSVTDILHELLKFKWSLKSLEFSDGLAEIKMILWAKDITCIFLATFEVSCTWRYIWSKWSAFEGWGETAKTALSLKDIHGGKKGYRLGNWPLWNNCAQIEAFYISIEPHILWQKSAYLRKDSIKQWW